MSFVLTLFVVSVLFLAYSNGANDNFKGVATLYGSGTCGSRTALAWATLTTLAGSLLALVLAQGLVATFRGKGLVPDAVTAQPAFLLAVSLGAALTIMVATRTGMPVSTTHALTGGLVGAGLIAAPGVVRFEALGGSFVLPLLLSPVVAILLTALVYPLLRWTRRRSVVASELCVCVGTSYEQVVPLPNGTLALVSTSVAVQVARTEECVERYRGRVLGADAGRVVDGLHFLSGGAVGFARGLNDTPKIVALLLAGEAVHPTLGLAAVALVMAVGGVLNARRVAADAGVSERVLLGHYVKPNLRDQSNRTYRRLLATLPPAVATRYGYSEDARTRLERELEAARAVCEWGRVAELAKALGEATTSSKPPAA